MSKNDRKQQKKEFISPSASQKLMGVFHWTADKGSWVADCIHARKFD